jgi:hypothetical protein
MKICEINKEKPKIKNPKDLLGRLNHARPVYPARGFTRPTRPTSVRSLRWLSRPRLLTGRAY